MARRWLGSGFSRHGIYCLTFYILGTDVLRYSLLPRLLEQRALLMIILLWIYILNQIVLFGAEVSKVYASTFGPHPKQHLPPSVERIVKPIERAGERIEQATRAPEAEEQS